MFEPDDSPGGVLAAQHAFSRFSMFLPKDRSLEIDQIVNDPTQFALHGARFIPLKSLAVAPRFVFSLYKCSSSVPITGTPPLLCPLAHPAHSPHSSCHRFRATVIWNRLHFVLATVKGKLTHWAIFSLPAFYTCIGGHLRRECEEICVWRTRGGPLG